MPLNFVAPIVRVTIGDTDWTDWIAVLRLSETRFDPGAPYLKSGEFQISQTPVPFPLDPNHRGTQQAYWRPWAQPVRIYLEGTLIATLRISKYVWAIENGVGTGQGQLADLLSKADQPTPTTDYGIQPGQPWTDSVVAALESAGLEAPVVPEDPYAETDSTVAPLKRDTSPIVHAAELAGIRGQAMHLTPTEVVAFAPYTRSTPAFALPREGVDTYDYQDDQDTFDQINVSGNQQIESDFEDDGGEAGPRDYDFTRVIRGYLPQTAIEGGFYVPGDPPLYGIIGTERKYKRRNVEGTVITQSAGCLWTNSVTWAGSEEQITVSDEVIVSNYDLKNRLKERIKTVTGAKGAAFPTEFEGNVEVVTLLTVNETWAIDGAKNCVRSYSMIENKQYLVSTPSPGASPWLSHTDLRDYIHTLSGLTTSHVINEEWFTNPQVYSSNPANQPWLHSVLEMDRDSAPPMDSAKGRTKVGPLVVVDTVVESCDGPPQPEGNPPGKKLIDKPFKQEVTGKDAIAPFTSLEISEDRLRNIKESKAYGAFLLALYWSRYYGRFVTLPARIKYWQPAPLATCYIDDQALIIEGRALVWAIGETAQIAFFGNHLGNIPKITLQPTLINADFSGPDLEFLEGVEIERIGIAYVPPSGGPVSPLTTVTATGLPPGLHVALVNINAASPTAPAIWMPTIYGTPTAGHTGNIVVTITPPPTVLDPTPTPTIVTVPVVVSPPAVPVPPPPIVVPELDRGELWWLALAHGNYEADLWQCDRLALEAETENDGLWQLAIAERV